MNTKLKIAVVALACALLIAFGWWRYSIAGKVVQTAIVFDISRSERNRCSCLTALAERALGAPGISVASTLTVFRTGDRATANEPLLLAQYQMPAHRKITEGKQITNQRREEILQDLKARCEKLTPTDRSPVFYAVKRTTEHLQSLGCGNGSACLLYVLSDGEELTEPGIKEALAGRKLGAALPATIPNEGVHILFIGLAQTLGIEPGLGKYARQLTKDRDPQRADRLQEVWTERFTVKSLVSFEPFCAAPANDGYVSQP